MTYYCATCEEWVDDRICPTCGEVAERVEDTELAEPVSGSEERDGQPSEPLSPLLQGPRREDEPGERRDDGEGPPAGRRERLPEPPLVDAGAPATEPPRPQEPATPSPEGRAAIGEAAQRQLRHFAENDFEIFLVAGIYQAGKTQLMDAFESAGFLRAMDDKKRGAAVLPTPPGTLNHFTVEARGRKIAFVDAAGESFTHLYPYLRTGSEVTLGDVSFLKLISGQLRGVVLLVDLKTLWHPELRDQRAENRQQEKILAWVLELLRWLRLDGVYEPGALSFQQHVDSRVKAMEKRLDVPVLVLFTKADELGGLPIGGRSRTDWMLRPEERDGRHLQPLGENPLLLARHRLPELYGAVRAHARHFRFDFVHSVVTDRDSGAILENQPPCGVDYSLGWLLDPAWQGHRFGRPLPSGFWIDLQERLDKLTGRGERWRRLPEPEAFR